MCVFPPSSPNILVLSCSWMALTLTLFSHGWGSTVGISDSTVNELRLFLTILSPQNGYPVLNQLTDLRIETILPQPKCKSDIVRQSRGSYDAIVASDASDFKVSCKWLEGNYNDVSFTLSESEKLTSSGERELLAMLKSLKHFDQVYNLTHTNLVWVTDSENLVSFINKGSSKVSIHAKVTEIYSLCHKMNCTIEPVHLLRTDERIQQVDELSKIRDTDNWSIDENSFRILHVQFNLFCDVFADANNKKLSVFISKNYEPNCWGVDAFSCVWPGVAYVCPPTTLLARVAKRIWNSQVQGIVILPNWPASDFFTAFFEKDYTVKPPFHLVKEFHPYIFQNEHARNTPLFGITAFSFFVLYFNTTSV